MVLLGVSIKTACSQDTGGLDQRVWLLQNFPDYGYATSNTIEDGDSNNDEDQDVDEPEKRAWNSGFTGGVGKRAWNSGFNGGVGKRGWNSGFVGGVGKRAWNNGFTGGVGKRAWNSGFTGGVGKRDSVDGDDIEEEEDQDHSIYEAKVKRDW